jgi:hypothetical protein
VNASKRGASATAEFRTDTTSRASAVSDSVMEKPRATREGGEKGAADGGHVNRRSARR